MEIKGLYDKGWKIISKVIDFVRYGISIIIVTESTWLELHYAYFTLANVKRKAIMTMTVIDSLDLLLFPRLQHSHWCFLFPLVYHLLSLLPLYTAHTGFITLFTNLIGY